MNVRVRPVRLRTFGGSAGIAAAVAGLLGCSWASSAASAPIVAQAACAALAGRTIPAASIRLATGGASVVSAAITGQDCVVIGRIEPIDPKAPPIRFELNLPADWNGKAVQFGGGGFEGVLVTGREPDSAASLALAHGFATFGSDSGHQAVPARPIDASFALNSEALANFAGNQLIKVKDAVTALLDAATGRAPRRVYFYGGSEGGREAMLATQRYGGDYDGVVAIAPAYDLTALELAGLLVSQRLYASPAVWLSPPRTQRLAQTVLQTCDGLDGLKDGLIANPGACARTFRLEALACRDGPAENCLTASELETARIVAAPIRLPFPIAGICEMAGRPLLQGGLTFASIFGFGESATPAVPPGKEASIVWQTSDQAIRFMVLGRPEVDALAIDPRDHRRAFERLAEMDATSVDIGVFVRRGGKMILVHGTADMAIPPDNTVAYDARLRNAFGGSLDEFERLYLIPGMGHGEGAFLPDATSQFHWLQALDDWRERGAAPEVLTMTDSRDGRSPRRRPACPYPQWPRYIGGEPDDARSFVCIRSTQ